MTFSPSPPTHILEFPPSSSACLPDCAAVQSSVLVAMAYDHDQTILQLGFCDGTVYQYFHVPRQTYQDLLQADSQGAYFNRHVRSVFRCARLHPDARSLATRPQSAVPR